MPSDSDDMDDGELPKVVTSAEGIAVDIDDTAPGPLDVHLDDVDDSTYTTRTCPVRVYIYSDEDGRAEELREVCDDLRNEYVYAQAVILPAKLREDGPPSSETITWLINNYFYVSTDDPSGS